MDIQRTLGRLAVAVAACLAVAAAVASTASAYSESYCGSYYANGVNCYAPGTHTWNYNDVSSDYYSNDICAYISIYSDGNGAIYGSGCAPGTDYAFCHAPVVNYYYAFGTHLNDSGSIDLYGFAETGVSCGALAQPPGPSGTA